jgi:hypothetical protein
VVTGGEPRGPGTTPQPPSSLAAQAGDEPDDPAVEREERDERGEFEFGLELILDGLKRLQLASIDGLGV